MGIRIEVDEALLAEAQDLSGQATKRKTVEEALRLMIRMRQQQEVRLALAKYRWRGSLARSREGRSA
jgi:Arc/MetJ family transcription regulator